ncbi:hypothetical protein G6F55_010814 [Rhizopus delemar]|nr:hypothetical protein G6F55_010814 [Rhizopus delemar]KAG1584407.1 hypothetical protein G6F48_007915 [Rhizopus delemar]KAG1588763.1 hypothetical protein G6F47_010557 [Rhizopus delemar]KAG1629499.1 hypothetical protein G6F44_011608 [Rhizopus delemar]
MTFRSKVVSRKHAEIFVDNELVYIRDTGSSSGTFLNNKRLSPPNECSPGFILRNNDIIQLGVDYQGGTEEIYRCVRMRIELNDNEKDYSSQQYNIKTYHSIQNLTKRKVNEDVHVEECCICLYAIAPFQALFVAPCSHTFHYKCLRPLLANHPGFVCPLCRHYSDLDANVSVEVEEVKSYTHFIHRSKVKSTRWFTKRKPISFEAICLFEHAIKIATEEMVYAVQSQGSIYYEGDYRVASDAVHVCLDQFHHLLQSLSTEHAQRFQHHWSEPLFQLRSRLDSLPLPLS